MKRQESWQQWKGYLAEQHQEPMYGRLCKEQESLERVKR